MPGRGLIVSCLSVTLLGTTLASVVPAAADIPGHPGVRLAVATPDGDYPGVGSSDVAVLSDDGRYAFMTSDASTLAPGDTNQLRDAFLVDLDAGSTLRISDAAGGAARDMSSDARYLLWRQWSPDRWVRTDRVTGEDLELRVPAGSNVESISDDGNRLLVNVPLLPSYENPSGASDHHVLDLTSGTLTRLAVRPDGAPAAGGTRLGATMSRDGSTVAFLVEDPAFDPRIGEGRAGVLRRRLDQEATDMLLVARVSGPPRLSDDGGVVGVSGENGSFLTTVGSTEPLSQTLLGLSGNGRFVFLSPAAPGGAVQRLDLLDRTRLDVTVDASGEPLDQVFGLQPSRDGSAGTFLSVRPNVIQGYVRRIDEGDTTVVCCGVTSPARNVDQLHVADGGDRVTFTSTLKLEAEDAEYTPDQFVWDRPAAAGIGSGAGIEGGTASIPVSLSEPRSVPTHVQWTLPPSAQADLTPASGVVVLPPGATQGVIALGLIDDDLHEPTEVHEVVLGGGEIGTVTVTDNDPLTASVAAVRAGERAGSISWDVWLDHPSVSPVRFTYRITEDATAPSAERAVAGRDFRAGTGSITIQPGSRIATISAALLDDLWFERDERLVIELTAVDEVVLSPGRATGTIVDDESAVLRSLLRLP